MERIGDALCRSADGLPRSPPIVTPRPVAGLVTRRVLVMDYLSGEPLSRAMQTMQARGIANPNPNTNTNPNPNPYPYPNPNPSPNPDPDPDPGPSPSQARGIDPRGPEAQLFGRRLLSSLTEAFGRLILEGGFFHADPHPGNVFV